MIKAINNSRYFKFFQPKLFYINQDIDNDDPVRFLSLILEKMDFSNLLQVFPNKNKVHSVNMFVVIIYAYSQGKYSRRNIEFLYKDSQRTKFLLNSAAERLNKCINYLEILGERNSFSKTDKEATFMRMKEDYMRNGQKPGYNLQIGVISEYIVFHNPSDTKTLIPFLEKIKSQNIEVKNVVADAGYESLSNYEYLKINNYVSYIKPIYYEKSKTRKY